MDKILLSLQKEASLAKNRSIKSLFAKDKERVRAFSVSSGDFKLDYSKQNISKKGWSLLLEYYSQMNIETKIEDFFSGKKVNVTEDRPALHFALRAPVDATPPSDMPSVIADVHNQLDAMSRIVNKIRSNNWRGYSGKVISDIVNLGVGGSELGPLLVCDALREIRSGKENSIDIHFVSSMDGTQISQLLEVLNPETTLFIISSKSFTTADTFYNVNTALKWLTLSSGNESLVKSHHFIGVSANQDKMPRVGGERK